MSIKCKEYYQKITLDKWDNDPNDMLMTVKCLPNFKFDLPLDEFPKVKFKKTWFCLISKFNTTNELSSVEVIVQLLEDYGMNQIWRMIFSRYKWSTPWTPPCRWRRLWTLKSDTGTWEWVIITVTPFDSEPIEIATAVTFIYLSSYLSHHSICPKISAEH